MPAPQRIKDLVENFKANFDHVQSNDYKEEDLRNNYLNPFFQELGWDMEDRAGKGPLRDLHYEKTIKSGAPDYGFYTDGKLRFFVEAKNPSKNVCNDPPAALQLRGYGWSAKTVRGILTDFEELSIYDTTVRPKAADQARVARLDCIKYTEFVERWDEIHDLFSREAVLGGSLEKLEKKRAKDAVDDGLLEDISGWRDLLAKNIANRNKLSEERLNRIVQDTIGRLLFLRICEDRGIAHEGDLREVAEGEGNYAKLYKLFKKAEQRYDSDLFEVASISDLVVDDKVLKEIISELYFPKSPYKFDAIPAEILGQVYEQFLGKVIRLTEGGHAKVEEKLEVRKAGGIYYTPAYIVEYIVRNTVGKLVEGKTPKKIETLSIVDPACGSGSFLLGAYKFLVDWYRDWYVADGVEKHQKAKRIYLDAAKQWQLTLDERKRILTAHIFGVDLDRQAVEMAKLSLMLEALRAPEQQSLFNDRMLPRMGDNVKCGNALIGTDYFLERPEPETGERELINPFDWDGKYGFPEIMDRGGFDVVIGNPPWGASFEDNALEYLRNHYPNVISRTIDSYIYFFARAFELTSEKNQIGFIVPSTILNQQDTAPIRKLLMSRGVSEIISLGQGIFGSNVLNTSTIIISGPVGSDGNMVLDDFTETPLSDRPQALSNSKRVGVEEWRSLVVADPQNTFFVGGFAETSLLMRMRTKHPPLAAILNDGIQRGVSPDFSAAHVITLDQARDLKLEKELLRPSVSGSQIKRYHNWLVDQYIILTTRETDINRFPRAYKFISSFRAQNTCREVEDGKHPFWALHRPRTSAIFQSPKFIGLTTSKKIELIYDANQSLHVTDSMYVFSTKGNLDPRVVMAVMQSRMFLFLYRVSNQGDARVIPQVKATKLEMIPFPADLSESKVAAQLPVLVNKLHELDKEKAANQSTQAQVVLDREIDAANRQIDKIVYALYGLTQEEARAIDGATK